MTATARSSSSSAARQSWTERYAAITKAAAKLDCRSAIIDGEVVVQNERGVSDFDALKSAIRWSPHSLIFCAFDLLHFNGKDFRDRPLLERRARLRELVPTEHPFLFSEEFTGDAAAFFRACADHQLEGIVSKLVSSKYRSGRSKTWLKTKCFTEGSFVIIGTARDRKTKAPLALLARAESQGLAYAGSAFIALSGAERNELSARLQMSTLERSSIPKLRIPDAQVGAASNDGARPSSCGKQVPSARYSPRNAVTTINDRDVVAHQIDRRIPVRAFSLAR
jgi:ATP-dependent DNA ligase